MNRSVLKILGVLLFGILLFVSGRMSKECPTVGITTDTVWTPYPVIIPAKTTEAAKLTPSVRYTYAQPDTIRIKGDTTLIIPPCPVFAIDTVLAGDSLFMIVDCINESVNNFMWVRKRDTVQASVPVVTNTQKIAVEPEFSVDFDAVWQPMSITDSTIWKVETRATQKLFGNLSLIANAFAIKRSGLPVNVGAGIGLSVNILKHY
jgi:hypothetical protein